MKAKQTWLGLLLVAALGTACTTAERSGGGGRVELEFRNPEAFSDMQRVFTGGRGADPGYLEELRKYVQRVGPARVPAGHVLSITVTDVDMAGDFEPHRGPNLTDVRLVRSVYPPRIDVSYRLTDAGGAVLSEGERKLRNQTFEWRLSPVDRDDPLRHEKGLMDDFLRDIAREK